MRLVSAVFMKEMVTLSRKKRHFFARALLLGVLLGVIAVAWHLYLGSRLYRGFSDLSQIGHSLFVLFTFTELCAIAILVPALTAPTIAAEKDRDTLGLLLMSSLRRINILLDKLLSRMCLMGLLLLAGLPLFLALLAFRGVSFGQIVISYAVLFGTVLFCSGVGLYFSTIMRKMHTALIASYACLAGSLFLIEIMEAEQGGVGTLDMRCFSPLYFAEFTALETVIFCWFCASVFFFCLYRCHKVLPRMAAPRKRHVLRRLFEELNASFDSINRTGIEVFDDDRALGRNAILWKETHKRFFSSNVFLFRATAVLLGITLFSLPLMLAGRAVVDAIVVTGIVLLTIIGLVASATAFGAEREKHSLEVLLSAPLTARAIVTAKFMSVLRLMIPILVCMGVWLWVQNCQRYQNSFSERPGCAWWVSVLLLGAAYFPMLILIGLSASVRRRRTSSAVLQAFLVFLAWCVAPVLVVWWGTVVEVSSYWRVCIVLSSMNPVTAMFGRLLYGVRYGYGYGFRPWACAALVPVWMLGLVCLVARFDRLVGRQ